MTPWVSLWDVVAEGAVIRVNPYYLYWLGGEVEKIRLLEMFTQKGDGLKSIFMLQLFRLSLQQMLSQSELLLPGCRLQAEKLLAETSRIITTADENAAPPDVSRLNSSLNEFRKFLEVGLHQVDLFQLQHRGIHDPKRLLFNAEICFSETHWKSLSESARRDWLSASQCLAYGVPTACGFHVFRALESVVLGYLSALSVTVKKRDLGHYLEKLKEHGAEPKVIEAIDQLRELHRNPLMHPEDFLSEAEAIDIYDLGRCAIRALMNDMQANLKRSK